MFRRDHKDQKPDNRIEQTETLHYRARLRAEADQSLAKRKQVAGSAVERCNHHWIVSEGDGVECSRPGQVRN